MAFDDKYRRKYIEEPKLEHYQGKETLANPPKQRTDEQQEKQDKLIKLERREAGEDSYRSRSASRRARRKRIQRGQLDGKYMSTNPLEALEEADANGDWDEMRPFERIGPDSTSMNGPVTLARAMRGEIPMRGSNPKQPYWNDDRIGQKDSKLDDDDGLKLSLEANLDIEIELKASIRGDLTFSLL